MTLTAPRAFSDGRVAVDAGGGIAYILGSGTFFGSSASSLGMGTALNGSVMLQVSPINSMVRAYAGLSHHYATGSLSGSTLGLQALFPTIRIALPGLWFSGGLTNIVLSKGAAGAGGGWKRVSDGFGVLGAGGIEYWLSPEASLYAALDTIWFNQNGTTSPAPSVELTAGIRIYFFTLRPGEGGGESSSSSRGSYRDGWRYPFGNMR